MSYRVRIDSFEGPFDLLLYLVSKQRIDIGSVSVVEIVDQYLEYVQDLESLDLDVASDFLLVASTLLELKARTLISMDDETVDDEIEELSPEEAGKVLLARLLVYKQYKSVASALKSRAESESLVYARYAGPDPEFANLMPDFLKNVSLNTLGLVCAECMARREIFLLESEHIAAKPLSVEVHVQSIFRRISNEKHIRFSELLAGEPTIPIRVVSFLAILELFKRSKIRLVQSDPFGDIDIEYIEGSGDLELTGIGEEE